MARFIAILGMAFLLLLFAGASPLRAQNEPVRMVATYGPKTDWPSPVVAAQVPDYLRKQITGRGEVMAAIRNASQQTGVDYHYLLAKAELESGLDPGARASTSSAAGLFQFIDSTWLTSLERYGNRLPIDRGSTREDRLQWRFDPHVASLVAAAFALDNARALENALGRKANNAELYLAHFLGSGAASRFLAAMKRNPGMAASRLFPKAARANRSVFLTRTGSNRSLAEVLEHFEVKLEKAAAKFQRPEDGSSAIVDAETLSLLNPCITGYFSQRLLGIADHSAAGLKLPETRHCTWGSKATFLRASSLRDSVVNPTITYDSEDIFRRTDSPESVKSLLGLTALPSVRPVTTSSSTSAQACDHTSMCYFAYMNTSTITQIRSLVESGAYTKAGIARAAGLHANTLRDASEPDWNPTAETLAKLQKFLDANDDTPVLVGIEEIIDEARNGRMYILVDDEDRENEGDLIIPAQMATPSAINFMATHGRGLICLALDKSRVDQLGLQPMSRNNKESMQTAFTVSIEAKEGVTTGISAADRARTVSVAIDATKGPDDIVTPGHVFPLMARDGGTLVRAGHTEAAVDISRLAGLNPSGVICEIMNEDGTMARLDDLVAFARRHNLKIGTIRDLIAYRMRNDHLVERIDERSFESDFGGQWRLITYRNKVSDDEAYVLQKGHVIPGEPTLARVHPISLFNDILGAPGPRQGTLQRAMGAVGEHGSGVIVILTQRVGSSGEWSRDDEHRNIGIGSQILADLGIEDMVLLTNSQPDYVALDGYGLSITDTKPIPE